MKLDLYNENQSQILSSDFYSAATEQRRILVRNFRELYSVCETTAIYCS
jgi:hypothetical protein